MAIEHRPGEIVPTSGIYRVTHDPNHSAQHEITAVRGEHFTTCNHCGHHPRFVLVHAAQHLTEHPHFAKR